MLWLHETRKVFDLGQQDAFKAALERALQTGDIESLVRITQILNHTKGDSFGINVIFEILCNSTMVMHEVQGIFVTTAFGETVQEVLVDGGFDITPGTLGLAMTEPPETLATGDSPTPRPSPATTSPTSSPTVPLVIPAGGDLQGAAAASSSTGGDSSAVDNQAAGNLALIVISSGAAILAVVAVVLKRRSRLAVERQAYSSVGGEESIALEDASNAIYDPEAANSYGVQDNALEDPQEQIRLARQREAQAKRARQTSLQRAGDDENRI
jgi:hypothetical protein